MPDEDGAFCSASNFVQPWSIRTRAINLQFITVLRCCALSTPTTIIDPSSLYHLSPSPLNVLCKDCSVVLACSLPGSLALILPTNVDGEIISNWWRCVQELRARAYRVSRVSRVNTGLVRGAICVCPYLLNVILDLRQTSDLMVPSFYPPSLTALFQSWPIYLRSLSLYPIIFVFTFIQISANILAQHVLFFICNQLFSQGSW